MPRVRRTWATYPSRERKRPDRLGERRVACQDIAFARRRISFVFVVGGCDGGFPERARAQGHFAGRQTARPERKGRRVGSGVRERDVLSRSRLGCLDAAGYAGVGGGKRLSAARGCRLLRVRRPRGSRRYVETQKGPFSLAGRKRGRGAAKTEKPPSLALRAG